MCRKTGGNASLIMTSSVLGLRGLNDLDRHHHREQYLPVTGEIQNTRTGNVYVFGNSDVTEEEINTNNAVELSELRVRGGKNKPNNVSSTQKNAAAENHQNSFMERIIIPGDTLQAFALQYGCPVSEIKRLNNLINDQDFHALTTIKLPVRRFGLLQEEEEERKRRPHALNSTTDALVSSTGSLDEEPASPYSGDESSEEHYYRTISLRMKDESDKRKFLKRMDKDIQKICQQTKTSKDSLDEVTKELTETKFYPLSPVASNKISWLTCDMSGKTLVLIVVALISVSVIAGVMAKIYSDMT